MKQIVSSQSTGKTRQLMEYAKSKNAIFVCENAYAMKAKAIGYGIVGLKIMGYYEFFTKYLEGIKYKEIPDFVIDELERFVSFCNIDYNWQHFLGYSLTLNEE